MCQPAADVKSIIILSRPLVNSVLCILFPNMVRLIIGRRGFEVGQGFIMICVMEYGLCGFNLHGTVGSD